MVKELLLNTAESVILGAFIAIMFVSINPLVATGFFAGLVVSATVILFYLWANHGFKYTWKKRK